MKALPLGRAVDDDTPSPKATRLRLALDFSFRPPDGFSVVDSILFFVNHNLPGPFLALFVRPTGLSKALQQRPRSLPQRAVHRALGQRKLYAECAAVSVDKSSAAIEVADVSLSLPRDDPLDPPDTQPCSTISRFTIAAVNATGVELTRTYPVGISRGRGSSPSARSSSASRVISPSFSRLCCSHPLSCPSHVPRLWSSAGVPRGQEQSIRSLQVP